MGGFVEHLASAEQVRQVEAQVDEYFRSQSGISAIWQPVMIEAVLEVAEEIITGHRAPQSEFSEARSRLALATTNNLNLALKTIPHIASKNKVIPPNSLKDVAIRFLGVCQAYSTLEDAFTSYWKNYATASFENSDVLRFDTLPNELDIRLRNYSADDELGGDRTIIPKIDIEQLSPIFETLSARSSFRQKGGFRYKLRRNHIADIANLYTDAMTKSYQNVPDINLGKFSFLDLVKGWALLQAISQLHKLITTLLAKDPTDIGTSLNWPALYRERGEWLRWFSAIPNGEAVMSALTMNLSERSADVSITPIVLIDKNYYGLVPSIMLNANGPRNLLVLAARRFQPAYSLYTSGREAKIIADFASVCGTRVIATSVNLPHHRGRQLPDIDVLLRSEAERSIVLTEIKWQLSAADTKEVIARNDYLKKGQNQLQAIKEFLGENPAYLRVRGFIDFDISRDNIVCLLLCKGHLGSADVLAPHSIMADYDVFVKYLREGSLAAALQKTAGYDYLPIEGRDFVFQQIGIKFGQWKLKWKYFHPPNLIPDNETAIVRDLYAATDKYIL